jgi:hypothetical protein
LSELIVILNGTFLIAQMWLMAASGGGLYLGIPFALTERYIGA